MREEASNLRGAALMAAAALVFTLEALVMRHLMGRGIPAEVLVAARAAGQVVWVAPVIARRGFGVFRSARVPMHVFRGLASLTCWQLYTISLARLDLATATVLSFTNVIFTVLAAGHVLGERPDRWRWAGALIGLLGIAVMVRPGGSVDGWGAAAGIASAIAWCAITLTSRSLTRTDATQTILGWVALVTFTGALPFAVIAWVPPAPVDWLVMVAGALVTPSIIWLVTEALRAGEASAIAPFQYLRLPLLALAGWLAYGEVPDAWGWAGAATIVAGALVVTVAEARRR
jgi:drug/metabolite transporter (DMT)-like permease